MSAFPEIDNWLKAQGGNLQGLPTYRLVWSDDERELRYGTFNDFTDSGLFLRQVTETRWVLKYQNIVARWILEKWLGPEQAINPELPRSAQGSYEPFYVFEDNKGNALPPTLKSVEFYINFARTQVRENALTRKLEFATDWEKMDAKELQHEMDMVDVSPMQSLLHTREGLGYTKGLKDK